MKRRRKLSEKAAELQAERGRKVSVKKPGSLSKLGKGEGPKGSSPVPTKLFVSNGSGGGGGPSSVTPKMKPREPAEDSQGYTEDEVCYSYPSSFFTLALFDPKCLILRMHLCSGAFGSEEKREAGATIEARCFIITH